MQRIFEKRFRDIERIECVSFAYRLNNDPRIGCVSDAYPLFLNMQKTLGKINFHRDSRVSDAYPLRIVRALHAYRMRIGCVSDWCCGRSAGMRLRTQRCVCNLLARPHKISGARRLPMLTAATRPRRKQPCAASGRLPGRRARARRTMPQTPWHELPVHDGPALGPLRLAPA